MGSYPNSYPIHWLKILIHWGNRGERSSTCQSHVCKMLQSIGSLEKIEERGLSVSTVAIISCREGRSRVRLADFYAGRLD
jgi:hypothetical protein